MQGRSLNIEIFPPTISIALDHLSVKIRSHLTTLSHVLLAQIFNNGRRPEYHLANKFHIFWTSSNLWAAKNGFVHKTLSYAKIILI